VVVAAAATLARGLGLLPDLLGEPDAPLLPDPVRELAARDWFWPVVAAGLVVVALLALRWLAVQSRSTTTRMVRLEPDPGQGQTNLPARVVAAAVEDDLAGAGLRHARATITGRPDKPRLEIAATVPAELDPAAARSALRGAIARHREALESDDLPATVLFR
jgi:hypothetical protein